MIKIQFLQIEQVKIIKYFKKLSESHILNKSAPARCLSNSFQKEESYKQKYIRSESAISCVISCVNSLHKQDVQGSFSSK